MTGEIVAGFAIVWMRVDNIATMCGGAINERELSGDRDMLSE
jgi:hypothetical protein